MNTHKRLYVIDDFNHFPGYSYDTLEADENGVMRSIFRDLTFEEIKEKDNRSYLSLVNEEGFHALMKHYFSMSVTEWKPVTEDYFINGVMEKFKSTDDIEATPYNDVMIYFWETRKGELMACYTCITIEGKDYYYVAIKLYDDVMNNMESLLTELRVIADFQHK